MKDFILFFTHKHFETICEGAKLFILVGSAYLRSLAVAMEVMEVMVMVGTVMSLKMDWLLLLDDTLFSLRVPMIIWRISLLASPRTASRA